VRAAVEAAVADAHRREWAFVLAATVRVTGDLDLAEECVQDAYARALTAWPASGIPSKPGAWLTTVARRRATDLGRRRQLHHRVLPLLVEPVTTPGPGEVDHPEIVDDRLRLIFTCCHPAISTETQVALTLRLVCGLTTAEISRVFLVQEATMAARLTRAKKKIALARIPFRVPPLDQLSDRIDAVLSVVHLMYTTGHTSPVGTDLIRRDLIERSLDLARLLRTLLPENADVAGLLALIVLTDARRSTRVSDQGNLVLLADQDRERWDHGSIDEGVRLVHEALGRHPPGRYALMAAIAAVHAEAPTWDATDWAEIVGLYDLLLDIWPSPVVALNRAVAVGLSVGPEAGLGALEALSAEPVLAAYSYLASARADFLSRLDRKGEARAAYQEALLLSENEVERAFLTDRLRQMDIQ
jgi:RNA polymerase sigma-70 factor (ECF subfamily)